jgi:hypothetical protein
MNGMPPEHRVLQQMAGQSAAGALAQRPTCQGRAGALQTHVRCEESDTDFHPAPACRGICMEHRALQQMAVVSQHQAGAAADLSGALARWHATYPCAL